MESFIANVLFRKKNNKKSRRVNAKLFYIKITAKNNYKIKQDGVVGENWVSLQIIDRIYII